MKHALLARILIHLNQKPAPWHYLDTHAGVGVYDLSANEASRTGEWRDGIARLDAAPLSSEEAALLEPYISCIETVRKRGAALYPGSPEIVRCLARADDRLTLAELHPEDARRLDRSFHHERRAKILAMDGWIALKANLPPKERRGLVLIDPPFEDGEEFERIGRALTAAHRKWSTGIYAVWYPIKDLSATRRFKTGLKEAGIAKIISLELMVDDPASSGALAGSGLIVVNPPWRIEAEAGILLSLFARILGRSRAAGVRIEQIAGE